MSLTLDGTSGITSSGGTNVLQADAVITANLQNGAVTTDKIANLGVTEGKLEENAVTSAKITDSNFTTAKIADLNVTTAKIADSNVTEAKIASNAVTTAKINNAAVTIAKLSATGTPSSSTFLRGDGSWQTISTTPTTDQVLAATAGASVGAVGTYALLRNNTAGTSTTQGSTLAGSSLVYTSAAAQSSGSPAGTWRSMGRTTFSENQSFVGDTNTLFLRIS